jgi:predicted RNA binding protein YcfA (HicA-like mRNA interferase family)
VIAALQRAGFEIERQSGSHVRLSHAGKRRQAVVPMHGGRDLTPGTLHSILKQAGLTVDEFIALL